MSVINELIREESNGTISFGNYELTVKSKVADFEHNGDLYKVKTFKEITKLERNGMFVYESVPGTAVENLDITEKEVRFSVEGPEDAQITLELEAEKEYKIYIDDTNVGKMKTNLGGKLMISVELGEYNKSAIRVVKLQ
ncbi:MAG: endosialidase [Anaerocolumna sp.]